MHKYLFNFFQDNNVITAFQSGFVPGDSTVNKLIKGVKKVRSEVKLYSYYLAINFI